MEEKKKVMALLLLNALQFFIQGLWSMTLGLVLDEHGLGESIKTAYFLLGIATISSPLFIGYISDKTKSPKRVLFTLHFLNGLNFISLYFSFFYSANALILTSIFISGLLFYPTTALMNSLTFQNCPSDNYFPVIRAFGTIGFMVCGFYIGHYEIENNIILYLYASLTSILMSIIVLLSPFRANFLTTKHTRTLLDSLKISVAVINKNKALNILICAELLMISQLAYSAYAPVYLKELNSVSPAKMMQIAVISELLFMFFLPFLTNKLSLNTLLTAGAGTYLLRNIIMVANDKSYIFTIFSLVLHGVAWVIFFIVLDIFIKRISLDKNNHQMQALKVILINGLGVSIASLTCGFIFNNLANGNNWKIFWSFPLITSLVAFVMLFVQIRKTPNPS